MSQVRIQTLHAGLNLKDDPSAMPEGATEVCIGVDLSRDGVLRVAKGVTTDSLTSSMKSLIPGAALGNYNFGKIVYLNGTRYALITTDDGLYANGTLISEDVTGTFDAVVAGNNIFISSSSAALRFDGTTAYQWGITAPEHFPNISAYGTGTLNGDYFFMYGWGRCDAYGNVLAWSGPALDTDGEPWIRGPITFSNQGVAWDGRVASADPQVNCCIIFISGGTLDGWWVYYVIPDNGTSSGSVSLGEADLYQRMISVNSLPAPSGESMVLWKDRIWMVDGSPSVKCSDISPYGDVMFESWPSTNSFSFTNEGGGLLSITEVNRQLVVRGDDGEWTFDISDPLDLTTIQANRNSDALCIGVRSVMAMPGSLIYPAVGSFIETNGSVAKAVMPEASSIISVDGMVDAVGVFRSFDGFFGFTDPSGDYVLAQLDLMSGRPRICYRTKFTYKIQALFQDKKTGALYIIYNGYMYVLDSGYSEDNEAMEFIIRTKAYSVGGRVTWMRLSFEHNTGGQYFLVRALVDGSEVGSSYFSSTSRKKEEFWFGPASGEQIQVEFQGYYTDLAEIYLPMTIHANG